ncbi:Calpain-type cysteine protease DEK1 [Diplonema papillatum]|nr:Calpain-type cysteine protease DEK1 [Diplonema papillatum]
MEFLGDKADGTVAALDASVPSSDPTLQEQTPGKKAGAAGGSPAKGGAGGSAAEAGAASSEVKDGLFEFKTPVKEGEALAYENKKMGLQYKVTYTFKNVEGTLKVHPDAKKLGDNKYLLDIYPGEKKEFARGTWNGQTRGIGSGAPDKDYLERQAKKLKADVEADINLVKEACKKSNLKTATADGIATVCAKTNTFFVDLTFPPSKASLFKDWETGMKDIPWKKPSQYLTAKQKPALFVGSVEPEDIDQGSLGDCYLLSALACLSEFEPLVTQIFDEGQDYDLGIYRATLCKNGWWHTIVMDSYLPCQGAGPYFAKNREEPNELWVALLEKAYAKLHGSYGSIRAGSGGMALADLTGCPYELFDQDKMTPELFKELEENDRNDYIQMLGTPGKDTADYAGGAADKGQAEMSKKYESVGLACGHAYSLISVKEFKGNQLCMIRNPWGNDKEWNGDWSDKSTKWTADAKKAVGWYDGDDGTFWMCWKDVCKWFHSASVCYVNGAWDQIRAAACFTKGVSDLVLKIVVKKDSQAWMGLHQKDPRGLKKGTDGTKYLPTQLNVLREVGDKLEQEVTSPYKPARDVNRTFKFSKGNTYYILAQTTDAEAERAVVLSMHLEQPEFADITFLTPAKNPRKYNPVTTFAVADYEKCESFYQLKGIFSTNGSVIERQGPSVDFRAAKRVLTAKEMEVKKNPKAAASDKGCGQYCSFPLEVTAIAAKGLPAMDDNGKSDPYLEMKLRLMRSGNMQNAHHKPQTQFTAAIDGTLDPKWGSKHPFSCAGDDALHVICYDKDTKGKDYIGEFHVVLADLDLKVGGAPVKKTFKLTGEIEVAPHKMAKTKGEVELAFSIPAAN